MGNIYLKLNDNQKALKYYKKSLKIDSKNAEVLNNLGTIYFNNTTEALTYFNKSIQMY